jgi:hypothetical protein
MMVLCSIRVVGLVSLLLIGLTGCRSDILKEQSAASPTSRLAARVEILEGAECVGMASVAKAPSECVWPSAARETQLLSAVVQVVAHVGADGRADGARVIGAPPGYDFDASAVQCALRMEYRPQVDASGAAVEGDTCQVSFRLARYVSDVAVNDPWPLPCNSVRTLRPTSNPQPSCDVP